MINFLKMLGVLVVAVIIPLVIVLAIWYFDHPIADLVQVGIVQFAVYFAIVYIIGLSVWMMYSDIKTKRYSKA